MGPQAVPGSPAGCSGCLPIAHHGLIGDMRSVALVGTNGTIDWYCSPSFDSPSVFAAILDANRGGSFELAAAVPTTTRQIYFPDTNVLITRFFAEEGVGEVQDFMPVRSAPADGQRLIRRVLSVRGSMPFRARVAPRFGYGTEPHTVTGVDGGLSFTSPSLSGTLRATVPLEHDRLDARQVQQMGQHQSCRPRAHDADVCPMVHRCPSLRLLAISSTIR